MQSVLKKKKKGCSGKDLQKGFKPGMKEKVGDGKLIIISMTVSGINDRTV